MYIKLSSENLNKKLRGRSIRRVAFNPFRNGRGGLATFPIIELKGGGRLRFEVQETDAGRYGIELTFCDGEGNFYVYGQEEAK